MVRAFLLFQFAFKTIQLPIIFGKFLMIIMIDKILKDHYGLTNCSSQKMDGYISVNYRIRSNDDIYVLKVYDYSDRILDEIIGETAMIDRLTHLDKHSVSKAIFNINNEVVTIERGENKIYRLLSYVEGDFLANIQHTSKLFQSLGNFMGKIDIALKELKNSGIESRKLEWDLQNLHMIKPLIDHIHEPSRKKIVQYFFIQWDQHVYPKLHSLRKSIIHNDANDWNIISRNNEISGIIDFGDSVYTATINELAIAITYGVFEKEDPLTWASYIVAGYNDAYPIKTEELDILFYLVAGRLVTSVCKSAHEKTLQPNSEYITISEQPAWALLKKWITINPILARNKFYQAANKQPEKVKDIDLTISKRKSSLGSSLSISYQKPIYMESAAFQYMFDKYGNTYLDAYNNIPHVGHQHPAVIEAAQKQISTLNTNTRYIYDSLSEYAELLLDKFPRSLNKVFFVNSGSAASDLAIRLTQNYTSRKKMVVMEHGYHGNTRMGVDISHYKYSNSGGKGKQSNIIEASIPDTYRGKFKTNSPSPGKSYAQELKEQIKAEGHNIAGFISEPIVGCGGQVPLAPEYLQEVYPFIRNQGGICISDEVQTGFGRLGKYFWGYEMHDVVPDMIILGKPIANGHPMGAVVTTEAIADAFDNGMEFFSSFGGNPVSCEIGKAVLNVIDQERLQENAETVGNYQMDCLLKLQKEFPVIGDVRGSGLFTGVELVNCRDSAPNTELAGLIKNEFRNRHILISTDGPFDSVLKSKPPLCFTKENVDQVINVLVDILRKYEN